MKEKIKKWFREWFTFFIVMACTYFALCVSLICIGEYFLGLAWLAIALFCVSTELKNKRIELMKEIIESYKRDYEKYEQNLHDMENSAIYYHLKWLHAQNDVRLCKRKIGTGKYLQRRKVLESKIEKMNKKIESRKQEKAKTLAG